MKNMLILFASITMFSSCVSIVPISAVNNKVDIGMTKTEFLAVALDRAKKDAMTETYYVYRIDQYNLDGNVIDSMFYYFRNSDDKLFEVNAGTKATDVNLNINNN